MADLVLKNVEKSYGPIKVIQGISLDIKNGEFIVFVGPSGCGKSTLLRMIAGLEDITSGEVFIDGQLVNSVPAPKRGISMVFQSYALYPHMTVRQNMSFGLEVSGAPKDLVTERVADAAEILQLVPYLDRLPKALSGGQRQRVAIGRAIVREPKIFLFDEPLSNLDTALRGQTRVEIARLHARLDATMIYVTHDQTEAMTLVDRIVVLNEGKIEQVGTPLELYQTPNNAFVAAFIGGQAMNFLPVENGQITLEGVKLPFLLPQDTKTVGIRPEHLTRVPDGERWLSGVVDVVEEFGESVLYHIIMDNAPADMPLMIFKSDHNIGEKGSRVSLSGDVKNLHAFDADGGSLKFDKL
ncbi:MAG: ABC transporter ATP-binding protein [Hyphomicrobiales bacterium]|nr:MAG: ABC transporter ATP-binding protein [Hyphomicrobiales bacterium]